MNAAGNYSAAYCMLHASAGPHTGHGMTFTIGRGNDLVCAAIPQMGAPLLGRRLSSLVADMGATWRLLVSDSQLRWLGPEKGVTHLALGAVVNALWDLWAKLLGKPVWRLVADMSPAQLVRCVDFRYIDDALAPADAVALLERTAARGRAERLRDAERGRAVPAYSTSAGWLGFDAPRMQALLRAQLAQGYRHFKLKVGSADPAADAARLAAARDVLGYDDGRVLMLDANQVWGVDEAISRVTALAAFKPAFIEEPTSPDDVLGHAAVRRALAPLGVGVATGEMCHSRVMFKQLLQARAVDVVQADACRLGGLNEVLAVLLLAAKFGVPVVPHSGGVGLPEYTQHVSTIDYVCVAGQRSLLEYVDALHEHFLHPASVKDGYYVTPTEPGYSVEMRPESMERYAFPGEEGKGWWRSEEARPLLEGEKI